MLVIGDIHNELFKQYENAPEVQQVYVDYANAEVGDWAVRHDIAPEDIAEPWHVKILTYAVKVALRQFAEDRAGFNHESRYQESDVYTQLYRRSKYGAQTAESLLVEVMFTGEDQTRLNRSVNSTELERG